MLSLQLQLQLQYRTTLLRNAVIYDIRRLYMSVSPVLIRNR